jgi:hypothetical protein
MGNAVSKIDVEAGTAKTWHLPGSAVGEAARTLARRVACAPRSLRAALPHPPSARARRPPRHSLPDDSKTAPDPHPTPPQASRCSSPRPARPRRTTASSSCPAPAPTARRLSPSSTRSRGPSLGAPKCPSPRPTASTASSWAGSRARRERRGAGRRPPAGGGGGATFVYSLLRCATPAAGGSAPGAEQAPGVYRLLGHRTARHDPRNEPLLNRAPIASQEPPPLWPRMHTVHGGAARTLPPRAQARVRHIASPPPRRATCRRCLQAWSCGRGAGAGSAVGPGRRAGARRRRGRGAAGRQARRPLERRRRPQLIPAFGRGLEVSTGATQPPTTLPARRWAVICGPARTKPLSHAGEALAEYLEVPQPAPAGQGWRAQLDSSGDAAAQRGVRAHHPAPQRRRRPQRGRSRRGARP